MSDITNDTEEEVEETVPSTVDDPRTDDQIGDDDVQAETQTKFGGEAQGITSESPEEQLAEYIGGEENEVEVWAATTMSRFLAKTKKKKQRRPLASKALTTAQAHGT